MINQKFAKQQNYSANQIVQKINQHLSGTGGGRDNFAMGGSNQFNLFTSIDSLLKEIK